MLARIREAVRKAGAQAPRDEVFPSDGAPVLVLREGKVVPAVMGWGFPGMQGGRNVINARAETAEERPMFRDGVAARRCVVPATGFYEWDADKRRYLFRMPARTELYMAALYGVFGGEARYCILTTQANASVAPVQGAITSALTSFLGPSGSTACNVSNTAWPVRASSRSCQNCPVPKRVSCFAAKLMMGSSSQPCSVSCCAAASYHGCCHNYCC